MDQFGGPTALLELAFTAVHDINRRSQDVNIHRRQCLQLSQRCSELVNTLQADEERSLDNTQLREAVDELEEVLLKIRKRVIEWANLNRVKSFMRQDRISSDIDAFNKLLDTHVLKFQIVSATELHRQQRKMDLYRQNDHEEVKEMLHKIIRNVEDLSAAVGMRDDVPALMQTIQEELKDEQPDTDTYIALRGGLDTLHTKTGILPPLTNLSGQVTKLSEHPVAEGGMADIYEGRWVGDEKVMLKAIRHVESESAIKRFRHEVDIWRPRLYAVAPWADGGNLFMYIRSHSDCDRMKLLSEVALGLKYLHSFKPTIVHGDLRAANVLVSATGEALLADFGLSKIVAEEEGAAVASTSLENAGSSRWMAPELFQVDASTSSSSVTPQSDVWSFGMLCLEVLTGCSPFFPKLRIDAQVIAALIQGYLPERPEPLEQMHGRGLSDEMWEVMNRCWSWRPSERPEMRTLASEVRALHVGYLRQYGVTSMCNNSGYHPSMYFDGSVWGSVANLAPTNPMLTPPSSSFMGSSPGSMRPMPLNDSPRTMNLDLPQTPTSPTASRTPVPGAMPTPRQRPDVNLAHQFSSLGVSTSPESGMSGDSWQTRGVDRSPTIRRVSNSRNRPMSIISASDIAEPNPHGHSVIKYDDEGNVLMGNLEGLVGRLLRITHAVRMDKEYRECFLTVYRGFAKVDDLWRILVDQYRRQYVRPETERNELKARMAIILIDWLNMQAIEPKDRVFLSSIQTFMHTNWSDEPLDPEQARLEKKVKEHMDALDQVPRQPVGNARVRLSELDPLVVAKQLMKMESDLFQKILASDIATWLKNIVDEDLVNIRKFSQSNYRIEDWCLSLILSVDPSEIEKRAQIITFLKRIAEECLQIRAFSCAHAIMSALTHDYVNGLEYTWRLVEKRVKDGLKQMSLLLSDEDKYKAKVDSEPQLPCVPILRIHLRDLSRSYREMQTQIQYEGEDLVNFQKFTEVWKSIKGFTKYQTPKPTITRDPVTAMYLEHAFAQLDANTELQEQLKARSEELRRKEKRDFNNRRLGMEDAGFRPPKKR
ncbi:Rap guanine nucleotide exchange factor [Ceratobasidium theobromae]|uniref:Rap guanine nucleotide exchange factor n=1 Tax=Ceratobasidium theobromae TaxID=1582974 RepID=A0A5N5QY45_9AGAM|nr:Rap guanine nucleotide exchange factor [Ceratobasidium theobromae]